MQFQHTATSIVSRVEEESAKGVSTVSNRRVEVLSKDTLSNSRLTVTPERVTLKIAPVDEDSKDELIALAHKANTEITYGQSLRGKYRRQHKEFSLFTDSDVYVCTVR